MRIGAQSIALHFLAEVGELAFARAGPRERRARTRPAPNAAENRPDRRRATVARRSKEMIEADLEDLRRRGIAGDVTAELAVGLVGTHHHRQRVPAHDRGDAFLDRQIPGVDALALERYGVAIRGKRRRGRDQPKFLGVLVERAQQKQRARRVLNADHRVEGFEPIACLLRVAVERVAAGRRCPTAIQSTHARLHCGLMCASSSSRRKMPRSSAR